MLDLFYPQAVVPVPSRVVRLADIVGKTDTLLAARRRNAELARAAVAQRRAAGTAKPRRRTCPLVLAQRARDRAARYREQNREVLAERARVMWSQMTPEQHEARRASGLAYYYRRREQILARKRAQYARATQGER